MKKVIVVILCVSLFACSTIKNTTSVKTINFERAPLAETDKRLVEMPAHWQSARKASFVYDGERSCNIYFPGDMDFKVPKPIVLIVNGYSLDEEMSIKEDDGALFKDYGPIASWGVALAARGLVAVTYDSFDENPKRGEKVKPSESIERLAGFLKSNSTILGIDFSAIGILAVGPSAKRFQQTLASSRDWLKNVKRVAYNWPVIDSGLIPKYNAKTLLIRSGKLSSSLLFELDDLAALLKKNGIDVIVHPNPTGGYNYDTMVDNEDTRTSIRTLLGFFEEMKAGKT